MVACPAKLAECPILNPALWQLPQATANYISHGNVHMNSDSGDSRAFPSSGSECRLIWKTWSETAAGLQDFLEVPRILQNVETFRLNLDANNEDIDRSVDVPGLLIRCLTCAPKLTALIWNVTDNANAVLHEAFLSSSLSLPGIATLRPFKGSEWLIRLCPNLESLEIGIWPDHQDSESPLWSWDDTEASVAALVTAAKHVKGLRRFRLDVASKAEYFEALLHAGIHLTAVTVGGWDHPHDIFAPFFDGENEDAVPGYAEKLKEHLHVFANFKNLKQLTLPLAHDLELGFQGAMCGNAYDGPAGTAFARQEARQMAETLEKAAAIVLDWLPRLEKLVFGSNPALGSCHAANLEKVEDGTTKVTWEWTGRMDEWTWERECWTEGEEFEGEDFEMLGVEWVWVERVSTQVKRKKPAKTSSKVGESGNSSKRVRRVISS